MAITLTDPMTTDTYACEAHPGWPLHIITDCAGLAGVRPYTRDHRCSICGLEWSPNVLVSQHSGCALERADGSRAYATCLLFVRKGDDWEQVTYEALD